MSTTELKSHIMKEKELFMYIKLKIKNQDPNSEPFGEELQKPTETMESLSLDLILIYHPEVLDLHLELCYIPTEDEITRL